MNAPVIHAIGTAVPAGSVSQAEALVLAQAMSDGSAERLLGRIYANPAVQRRASVLIEPANGHPSGQRFYPPASVLARGPGTGERLARYAAEAPALGEQACRAALSETGVAPSAISHLITVSCTGFAAPGLDARLIDSLGLAPTAARTHVGFMGCHGAINGLRIADAICRADPAAAVLLCAVELCSLHFQYTPDPGQAVANSLFADGAAAAVVQPARPRPPAGGDEPLSLRAFGSCLFPDSAADMTWTVGDHGFRMTLSPRVPDLLRANLRPWLEGWLATNGLTLADIRSWAVHPGGPRILDAVAESLDLPPAALAPSRDTLACHGNMSSPTVLFILDQLRHAGAPRPTLSLAFGPGLVAEAMLLD